MITNLFIFFAAQNNGIYRLCLNSGDASFEGCIRRAIESLRRVKGCPILKAPSNAADKCSLLFPDLKDTQDVSFTTQRIPRIIACCIFSEMASERAEAAVALHIQ